MSTNEQLIDDLVARLKQLGLGGVITNESVALDANIAQSKIAGLPDSLDGKADLQDGKVVTSQIPAVSLIKPRRVANRAAMLALTAEEGDVAVITGTSDKGTYMLGEGPSTDFASWVAFVAPDDLVSSVNGQTGVVVLGKTNVGLGNVDNTSDANKPISTAVQTALDAKPVIGTGANDAMAGNKTAAGIGGVACATGQSGQVDWIGTQAQYDALSTGVKNTWGFKAVIV